MKAVQTGTKQWSARWILPLVSFVLFLFLVHLDGYVMRLWSRAPMPSDRADRRIQIPSKSRTPTAADC